MKKLLIVGTAVTLIAGSFATAFAQDNGKHRGHHGPHHLVYMFKTLDTDDSGTVSRAEFEKAGEGRLARADTDKDGALSAAEIDAHLQDRLSRMKERLLNRFDENKDGTISAAEMAAHREERFAKLDANSNGEIERKEIRKAMKEHHRKHGKHRGRGGPDDGGAPE